MTYYFYIDANVFLSLYGSSDDRLLEPFRQLQLLNSSVLSVFVTDQLANEVNRNKLDRAKKPMEQFLAADPQEGKSPLLVMSKILTQAIQAQSGESDSLFAELSPSERRSDLLFRCACEAFRRISDSEDEMSLFLAPFFSSPRSPSEYQMKEAWRRKACGIPPGKSNDPIGDEISWVQLLHTLKDGDRLWLVSNDSDYSTRLDGRTKLEGKTKPDGRTKPKGKAKPEGETKPKGVAKLESKRYLNPVLASELKGRGFSNGDAFVFDHLSDAIKHFIEETRHRVDPETARKLDEAKIAEDEAISREAGMTFAGYRIIHPIGGPGGTWTKTTPLDPKDAAKCPQCGCDRIVATDSARVLGDPPGVVRNRLECTNPRCRVNFASYYMVKE
jgi:hypothetical protein